MANRVTEKMLQNMVDTINTTAGKPVDSDSVSYDELKANECYNLSGAYGGWRLEQYCADGGSRTITSGYEPKRQCLEQMQSFLSGMQSR